MPRIDASSHGDSLPSQLPRTNLIRRIKAGTSVSENVNKRSDYVTEIICDAACLDLIAEQSVSTHSEWRQGGDKTF